MAGEEDDNHSYDFECVDELAGTFANQPSLTNGAVFYHAYAKCVDGAPCPFILQNRPITCVVCTK